MNRRDWMKTLLLGASALALPLARATTPASSFEAELAALERRYGGRLGVAMLDTGSGRRVGYRAGERFMMCSTGKLLAVGAVLARVDRGAERLDRRIVFGRDAILGYAPVTRRHVGAPGLTLAELCRAAITVSDNTAMNLLLARLGGPVSVTAFARALGDAVTRFDRTEPSLNVPAPDGVSDTTAPEAMLGDLRALLLGTALSASSRARLATWMQHCATGRDQLRAGMPAGWRVGDKTGSGATQANDVAVAWPPGRAPLLVAAYYEGPDGQTVGRKAALARVGALAAALD